MKTETVVLQRIENDQVDLYNLKDFEPQIVNREYLDKIGVKVEALPESLKELEEGAADFIKKYYEKRLIPKPQLRFEQIPLDVPLPIHDYTGSCPTSTYEINPVLGCNVGCLYCLVTDGIHPDFLTAYENYSIYLRSKLEENFKTPQFYYFSPKTEAFQEPTLQTGIAHDILREFIRHYEKHPDSKAKIFIASKAGTKQLLYEHRGESILDLMTTLSGKIQFNTSVSIMPPELRRILEPTSASIEDRLRAVTLCNERGILSESALVQPIIGPFLTTENLHSFFSLLSKAQIVNFKPEFLTACMKNLAMIGQFLGYFDKKMEKELYELYLQPENVDHRKQRGRTAPIRKYSYDTILKMRDIASQYGITSSICYWVRKELRLSENEIPIVNQNGYKCLGYQTKLLDN